MTSAPTPSPSPRAVHGALRRTTETLARELAAPTATAPDWSEFEWLIARATAAMHGVSALLAGTLRWEGPPGWTAFLREQRQHIQGRHARLQELLERIDRGARQEGIALVALKGVELHARGLYAPGERPMGDVDLLVRASDCDHAARMLVTLGFREAMPTWKHRVFLQEHTQRPAALGEHVDNYLKVELHDRLREPLPLYPEEVTRWVFPSGALAGLNRYPSTASLMTHLLLHAAGAMTFRALRMLHVHDLALLAARMSTQDWDELLAQSASDGGHWWAAPPLFVTARYYPAAISTRALEALRQCCPRRLARIARRRTLSEVSFSNLWITAFPGIEWSHSPSRMAHYVLSRVRPSKHTLALRQELVLTHLGAGASQWDRLSQGQRIVRWLTSRQPRSETMHPVLMALAQMR